MSQISPVLALPFIQAAQAQKHVTHNEALQILDLAVQLAVDSRALTTPPTDATTGTRHIVAPGATGAWAGHAGRLALFDENDWRFCDPRPGWRAHVLDEAVTVVFDGTGWTQPVLGAAHAERLGINAQADATNRLVVAAQATLFSHDGADHQMKINKATATDTASLLFQTGFSGRAEMGTAGSDDFALKVSADGAIWRDGLIVARSSGAVSAPNGLDAATLTHAGSPVYARANLLGTVSQTAGVPTGAVIQRDSNVNGEFVRFADGTQICVSPDFSGIDVTTAAGGLFRSASPVDWTFPAAFGAVASIAGSVTSMANAQTHWGTLRVTGGGSAQIGVFGATPMTNRTVRAMAVGRWF